MEGWSGVEVWSGACQRGGGGVKWSGGVEWEPGGIRSGRGVLCKDTTNRVGVEMESRDSIEMEWRCSPGMEHSNGACLCVRACHIPKLPGAHITAVAMGAGSCDIGRWIMSTVFLFKVLHCWLL